MENRSLICPMLVLLCAIGAISWPAGAGEGDVPRTESGRPDLSGNYDVSTLTPFERSREHGERRALTPEEVAEITGRAARGLEAQSLKSDPNRSAPDPGANVGGYNAFWIDRGTAPVLVRGEYRTSILTEPANGRRPPLTERGRARIAGLYPYQQPSRGDAWWLDRETGPYDGPESLSILDRCIFHPEASIPVQPRAYNNLKTIVQTDTHVVILVEWMHEARVVRLDDEHAPPQIRSRGGDSIGWWEGDTLVVDTTNFLEENWATTSIAGAASFTADQHVVERFRLLDAGTLLYEFIVESSDYETPFGGEYTWPRTEDRLFEYACHEGNYAMGNILRGARLLEQEAAAVSTQENENSR
jgi:hypothetical protein